MIFDNNQIFVPGLSLIYSKYKNVILIGTISLLKKGLLSFTSLPNSLNYICDCFVSELFYVEIGESKDSESSTICISTFIDVSSLF